MISLIAFVSQFIRTIRDGLKEPEFRGLFYSVVLVILMGTLFYMRVEDWSMLDSLYFTVITLTTVGYGDFSPHTAAGKLFTIIYIFIGLGLFLAFIEAIATRQTGFRLFRRPDKNQKEVED